MCHNQMPTQPPFDNHSLLDALLDSWRRNNTILVNLLRALPEDTMELSAVDGSPTVRGLFMHMHYCRMVFVHECTPELGVTVPQGEWRGERDRERIVAMLNQSAEAVRDAFVTRLQSGRPMDTHYDHPILLLQHFVWHEGYHHGQIKVALKRAGRAFDDEEIGRVTWDVWMEKETWR